MEHIRHQALYVDIVLVRGSLHRLPENGIEIQIRGGKSLGWMPFPEIEKWTVYRKLKQKVQTRLRVWHMEGCNKYCTSTGWVPYKSVVKK